jgi:hypothetical protein
MAENMNAPTDDPARPITSVQLKSAIEREKNIKRKPFKWPWGKKRMMASAKKPDEILVFLLNLKKQIEGPFKTKIYGGNLIVIRNRAYRFNPDRVFGFGKFKAIIAREFDRELVGIDDYTELMRTDVDGNRVNINDPVLIKALLMARMSEKPVGPKMNVWIWVILGVVGLIAGYFIFFSGGKAAPAAPAAPIPIPAVPAA